MNALHYTMGMVAGLLDLANLITLRNLVLRMTRDSRAKLDGFDFIADFAI